MTPNEQARPLARKADLVTSEVADELLVYDLKSHKAHCLNQTAAMIWKYCDGKTTIADLAQLLGQEVDTNVDEAAVWLAIAQLNKAHLLEERVTRPAGSPRLSRRQAIRQLSWGTALAVPVVISIVAPTALAGCTGLGAPNAACTSNAQCCSQCCDRVTNNRCEPGISQGGKQPKDNTNRLDGSYCSMANQCCSNMCSGNPGTCFS